MKGVRIATRYAKSLLILSLEKQKLDDVYNDMQLVANTIKGSRDLKVMLSSPVIKPDTKNKVLDMLFSSQVNEITGAFIRLLTNKGRESMLGEISASFVEQVKEYKKVITAHVVSASVLDSQSRSIISDLATKLAGGKSIELDELVNEDLIGGFILKVGDQQVDASVSGEIKSLRREFEKNLFIPGF